jgi:hypothetical protein
MSGRPVDFDHVAVRVVKIGREGYAVVDHELDRDVLPCHASVQRSQLGESDDLESLVSERRVGEQSYLVRLLVRTAAQKFDRSERLARVATAGHAERTSL